MLDENSVLNYECFNIQISTNPDKSKTITVSGKHYPEDKLYSKTVKYSKSEIEYAQFEQSEILNYAFYSFLNNLRKVKNDSK